MAAAFIAYLAAFLLGVAGAHLWRVHGHTILRRLRPRDRRLPWEKDTWF
jgi:hypothetical protein